MTAIVLSSSNHLSLPYDTTNSDEEDAAAARLLSALQNSTAANTNAATDTSATAEAASSLEEDEEAEPPLKEEEENIDEAMQEILMEDEEEEADEDETMTEASVALAPLETTERPQTPPATSWLPTAFSAFSSASLGSDAALTTRQDSFAGLSNLGNTCYMASALQMLASLDGLNWQDIADNGVLSRALVTLLQDLQKGDTVHPEEFKETMDQVSPLFVGYRQQDSHEFLITLLDLLDEEYKKANAKQDQDEEMEQDTASECTKEDRVHITSSDDEGSNKRARTEEPLQQLECPATPPAMNVASLPTATSFSDFNVEDIGRLLHDTQDTADERMVCSPTQSGEPKCKLVGGRMNTADVVLTRFGDQETQRHPQQATTEQQPMVLSTAISSPAEESPASPEAISPLAEHFTTTVRVRLTCDSCKYTRCHEETFWHLSLEIAGSQTSSSVEEGLRRFFASEQREIKCEKCFCATATQTSEVCKLPRALLLHFKRFIVDVSPDYTSVTYRKNQSAVAFPDQLSLDGHMSILGEFMAADCTPPPPLVDSNDCSNVPSPSLSEYQLRSVVNHMGSSASCGHYTADAHRFCNSTQQRQWTRFNDSYVSSIRPTQAVEEAKQTAYMVLYEVE